MTPLRSISQIPRLNSTVDKKGFGSTTDNPRVTQYTINGTYLSALDDDQLLIETSYRESSDSNYVSRSIDFGKLLRYITNALSILDNAIVGDFLTRTEAIETYLPLSGGTLCGPLEISSEIGGPDKTDQPALTLNYKDGNGDPAGIEIQNAAAIHFTAGTTTITEDSIETKDLKSTGLFDLSGLKKKQYNGENVISVTIPFYASTDAPITAHETTTDYLTVNNDLALEKNLTVKQKVTANSAEITTDLSVNGTATVNTDLSVNGTATVNTDLSVNGTATVNILSANGEIESSAVITGNKFVATTTNDDGNAFEAAHGKVVAPIINGTTSVFVNETLKMTTTDGLVATSKISQLTAQYACWA